MFRLLLAASLVTLVSCTPKSSGLIEKGQNSSIINGHEVKEGAPITASIVALFDTKENFICTGSLIAPNIVLTAAHCMPNRASDLKVVFANNVDSVLNAREQDILQTYVLTATDFKTYSTWKENSQVQVDRGDIALVKFKGQAPEGYKPATFLPDQSALKKGAMVTVAGYGVDLVETKDLDPKKYRGNLDEAIEFGEVICDDNKRNCMTVDMSGDGILRQTEAPISSLQQTELRLDESKAGTCSGDSGGPAYIEKDGKFYLFGITSRGSVLCDDTGVYTNALEYKQWIADTIKVLK
ncbi:S1 family peptidase [Bdellovibrio svalbardensis]|uniref:Trypsin-like serine protease n=1 Tax=Bdellovibrio svalbardensis TaxID=2972972 RepID=A0ABT6DG04_9BACT|nr:trypsin-like serine protease [Bdellovibrio svalbardensis]MDG0815751.1 trypsin-like serine protease [Bdellovibrio svalbardensis]